MDRLVASEVAARGRHRRSGPVRAHPRVAGGSKPADQPVALPVLVVNDRPREGAATERAGSVLVSNLDLATCGANVVLPSAMAAVLRNRRDHQVTSVVGDRNGVPPWT